MQWEDRFFESNRGNTYLGNPENRKETYPDYVGVCKGFGIAAEHVSQKSELRPALERMLAAKESYVLDVKVPYTEHVLPMIPAGKTVYDIILE